MIGFWALVLSLILSLIGFSGNTILAIIILLLILKDIIVALNMYNK
jgi:hypothetical protein